MSRSAYGRRDAGASEDPAARSSQSVGGRLMYRTLWTIVFLLIKLLFRIKILGRENLPKGPYILSPVHRSFLDTPFAGMVTSRRMRFMGKESLWSGKFLGPFLSLLGGFPVERGTADRVALRAATDVLKIGEPLVMFPEGTRRSGPRVKREDMLDGPAFVAARAGVPIIPVGLGGSVRALPVGSWLPRPRRVVVVVGNPIDPPAKIRGRVPRRAVRETTDRLFEELGDLYVEARVLAGDEPTPT